MNEKVEFQGLTYERVADAKNTVVLKDQLDALDLELLKVRPVLVASLPEGGFAIYSDIREMPGLMRREDIKLEVGEIISEAHGESIGIEEASEKIIRVFERALEGRDE